MLPGPWGSFLLRLGSGSGRPCPPRHAAGGPGSWGPPGVLPPSSLETPKSAAFLWQGRLRFQGRRSVLRPNSWSSWGRAGLAGPGAAQVSVEGTLHSGSSRATCPQSLASLGGSAVTGCSQSPELSCVGDRQARHRASGAPAKAPSCPFSALGTAGHSRGLGGAGRAESWVWSGSLQGRASWGTLGPAGNKQTGGAASPGHVARAGCALWCPHGSLCGCPGLTRISLQAADPMVCGIHPAAQPQLVLQVLEQERDGWGPGGSPHCLFPRG